MTTERLLNAIGTMHCPYCQMPLFAHELAPGRADLTPRGRFVAPFVCLFDNAFDSCAELVETAERLDLWSPAAVVGKNGTGYGESRGNEFMPLTPQFNAGLEPWEETVRGVFHAAAHVYLDAVDHLTLRSDLGYQVLRYRPGEGFREHIDVLPGPAAYGQRQLTAILYLNDNFEGGELSLTQQRLLYNPRAGSLLMFPSGFCFPHSSLPVHHGTKYCVVTWFV